MGSNCPAHQDAIIKELHEVKNHLSDKIEELEGRLLEPDDGLYTRVRKNTNFRKTAKRWLSIISVSFIGMAAKGLYDFFKGRG